MAGGASEKMKSHDRPQGCSEDTRGTTFFDDGICPLLIPESLVVVLVVLATRLRLSCIRQPFEWDEGIFRPVALNSDHRDKSRRSTLS